MFINQRHRNIPIWIIGFFVMACGCVRTQADEHDRFKDQKMFFDYLCSPELGGRYSGSEGIKKAANFIIAIIADNSNVTIDTFDSEKGQISNIIYHVEGESDTTIVIGAHYDAYGYINHEILPGADDNLSGVSVVMQMIKTIQEEELKPLYCIDLCLWDGEEIGRYGSRHYVKTKIEPILLYINVDTCGGNKEYGLSIGVDQNNPSIKNDINSLAKAIGASVVDYIPVGYATDCDPFLTGKVPFFTIGGDSLPSYLHSINDVVSNISFEQLDLITNNLYTYLHQKVYGGK